MIIGFRFKIHSWPAKRVWYPLASDIYQEIIPRSLTWVMQVNIAHESSWYTRPDGSLDMRALLRAFQEFFAEHSESWLGRYEYREAGPHLLLMAFLFVLMVYYLVTTIRQQRAAER